MFIQILYIYDAIPLIFFGIIMIITAIYFLREVKKSEKIDIIREKTNPVKIVCPKCNYKLSYGNTRCPNCGTSLEGVEPQKQNKYICDNCKAESDNEIKFCAKCGSNQISIVETPQEQVLPSANTGKPINKDEYSKYLFESNEEKMMNMYIEDELKKNLSEKSKSIIEIEIKRTILTIIYCIILLLITFLYVSYHTNLFIILFLVTLLTIYYIVIISKSGLKKILLKKIKSRPDEKISYVVASTLSSYGCNKYIGLIIRIIILMITVYTPFVIFKEPHFIYEKVDNGYNLRYYTLSLLKNDEIIEIPENYKGENVIGIRGDVFERVTSIKKVILPNTIEEIRGGAFKYCTNLKEINLPPKITEIHGDTFQGCTSLETIVIPEGVTRIGGSAFRNCSSLREVIIPKTVTEIGSSAFRETNITNVCISNNTYVNERAFKGTYAQIYYYENNCEAIENRDGINYYG